MKEKILKIVFMACTMYFNPLYCAEHNISLSLGDLSNKVNLKDVSKVNVNIKEVLLKVSGQGEIQVGSDIGVVNLLSLSDKIKMDIGKAEIPEGAKVTQVRLILDYSDNSVTYSDGSVCQLTIPCQKRSPLKVVNPGFSIQTGKSYDVELNFNAEKSLVFKGNGGCAIKPVIQWGGVSSVVNSDDTGSTLMNRSIAATKSKNSLYDGSVEGLIDCNKVKFDLYNKDDWPSDFNFEDYKHCY